MKILITGGAGFIGSHLADALLAEAAPGGPHEVTIVDDLTFGKREQMPTTADFAKLSITDPKVETLIAESGFDLIYHCAAQKSVRVSFDDPLYDAEVNVMGLVRVMEAARKANVKNVVFMSTGGTIYGEAAERPTAESAPVNPQNPYTVSKASGELYLNYYASRYGMNCLSLRLGNVYGPRQDPKGEAGVIAIFLYNIFAGEPVLIYGDGEQTRDYIYVDDVVAACLAVLPKLDQKISGAYNIGTGRESSVNQIAKLVLNATGEPGDIIHADAVPGELRRSAIASQKFSQAFGWEPKTPVEMGIIKTFEWFKAQHQ